MGGGGMTEGWRDGKMPHQWGLFLCATRKPTHSHAHTTHTIIYTHTHWKTVVLHLATLLTKPLRLSLSFSPFSMQPTPILSTVTLHLFPSASWKIG